jgi:hypothetical protein
MVGGKPMFSAARSSCSVRTYRCSNPRDSVPDAVSLAHLVAHSLERLPALHEEVDALLAGSVRGLHVGPCSRRPDLHSCPRVRSKPVPSVLRLRQGRGAPLSRSRPSRHAPVQCAASSCRVRLAYRDRSCGIATARSVLPIMGQFRRPAIRAISGLSSLQTPVPLKQLTKLTAAVCVSSI